MTDPPPPGGPLLIGSGGIAVDTDELALLRERLLHVAADADEWAAALASAQWLVQTADADAAHSGARAVAGDARELAAALEAAADAYGATELLIGRAQETAGGVFAWLTGLLAPAFVPAMLAVGAIAGVDVLLAALVLRGLRAFGVTVPRVPAVPPGAWRLLNDPVTVAVVRTVVSAVDDGAGGAARLPLPLVRALGESGIDLTGAGTSALGVLAVAGVFGSLRDGPVAVRPVRSASVAPPAGVGELLERVPPSDPAGAQLRIERYGDAGTAQWVVYLGGTSEWRPAGADQPWDLTSDVQAVAGTDAGSLRAVEQALADAGARPGDRLLAVGHSQGGILAARLAAEGDYDCVGLVTAGAPLGGVGIPPEVPVLALEHSDDVVPALGGVGDRDRSPGHLLVRREYLAGRALDGTSIVPAHELVGYRETAGLVDASQEARLEEFRRRIAASVGEAPGDGTWWRAERVGEISAGRQGGGSGR